VVVQVVPQAIQDRRRSNGEKDSTASRGGAGSQKQQAPASETKSRDERPISPDSEKSDDRAPVLVRMLIVIESEPPRPDAPAARKGPGGGAS
jgi:hypothetical protein